MDSADQQQIDAEPETATAPRRRRSRRLTVGLPVAGLLLAGGIVAAIVTRPESVTRDIRPAQQAARSYATAIVHQRWQSAHDQLCAEDRATLTAEKLSARYGEPRRTGFTLLGVAVVTGVDGRLSAFTDIEFTTADGQTTTTHVPLVADGSRWRPCL